MKRTTTKIAFLQVSTFLILFTFIQLSASKRSSSYSAEKQHQQEQQAVNGAAEEFLIHQLMSNSAAGAPATAAEHQTTSPLFIIGANGQSSHRLTSGRRGWRRNKAKADTIKPAEVETEATTGTSRMIRADAGTTYHHKDTIVASTPDLIPRHWIELESVPPTKISAKLHGEVVLECEAVGSPPPLIYWLKDGKPLDHLVTFDSEEMMNGLDTRDSLLERRSEGNFVPSNFAMAKIKSKLPLRCIRPEEEGQYSCVADNLRQQVLATTTVAIEEDDPSDEWKPECEFRLPSFLYHKKGQRKGTQAYIHVSESLHMENMGKDIILPCRAGGKPKPLISWTGADGQLIVPGNKYQINPNGDLLIKNLSWQEMGEFTCLAENTYGVEVASTFLYPLLNDEAESSPQIQPLHQQQNR